MITIKIEKRKNGTVASVLSQGHSNAQVDEAIYGLMQACGRQLEAMRSGIMQIADKEMCYIDGMKQSKPSIAVVETLTNGLENACRKFPFSVNIKYTSCEE